MSGEKDVFDYLPEASNAFCCFSLQFGSIVIALIIAIFTATTLTEVWLQTPCACFCCYKNNENSCETKTVYYVLRHCDAAVACVVLVACKIFLVGVCTKSVILATVYLYMLTIHVVVTVIMYTVITNISIFVQNCEVDNIKCASAMVAMTIFYFYSLVVVKSYRAIMPIEPL
nr:uncharacterized protein LOC128682970 [Plodia interpunctella]